MVNDQASKWLEDWQTWAKRSWESWADATRRASAPSVPGFPPGFGSPPDTGEATAERMLQSMKDYFQWMQSAAARPDSFVEQWREGLEQMFERAGQPLADAMSGFQGLGATAPGMPGADWMKPWQQSFDPRQLFSMPAFGATREYQEQQQALMRAMLDYADKFAQYRSLIAKANAGAVERLQDMLAEHAEPGREVDSLRGLYNLWVDAAEAAYADMALSEPFREVYGELVNAQMRVRSLQQQQIAQLGRLMGMPTRDDVDSLGRRLQELRREIRSASLASLETEVESLRGELERLHERVRVAEAAAEAPPARGARSAATKPRRTAGAPGPAKAAKKASASTTRRKGKSGGSR